MMLDLLNAEVLEGTELKEVGGGGGVQGGGETMLTQHRHHQNDSALTAVLSHLPLIVRGKVTRQHFID